MLGVFFRFAALAARRDGLRFDPLISAPEPGSEMLNKKSKREWCSPVAPGCHFPPRQVAVA
jgi:hypothetical protein